MNSSLANSCLSDLPEELILEILVRLPAKSLVRFKTVCKRWKTLITNPSFTKSQFHSGKKNRRESSHLLLQYNTVFALNLDVDDLLRNPTEIRKFVPLHSKPFHLYSRNYYSVMGTCNGIICFRLNTEMKFCLWNPTINESRFVSYPDDGGRSLHYNAFIFSGFGYASSIDDYKIVLVAPWSTMRRVVFVYSLRRNSWSNTICCIPDLQESDSACSDTFVQAQRCMEEVVLNDALLFVMSRTTRTSKFFIVKFDLVNECFEKVADLPEVKETRIRRKLLWTEIGVVDDNKIVAYYVYREKMYTLQDQQRILTRDVVEVHEMLDQHGCSSSWKMMYNYIGDWEAEINEDVLNRDLIRITSDGKVLMFADSRSLGKWQVFDITQDEQPSLIHIDIENSHQTKIKAKYVSSLISPNSF